MSGGSANNSWTIVTPEETVAETLRPLAEGTENHGGSLTSAAVCGEKRPADCAQSAEGLPVEGHLLSEEEKPSALSGDTSAEQHRPAADSDASVPRCDELSQSAGQPGPAASTGPDTDSFSDTYAHIAPSPDEPSASLPSTETLGGVELTQEEERLAEEGTRRQLDREELQQEGEESDLSPKPADLWKQAVYLVDQLVMEWFCIWARKLSGEAVVEEGDGRSEKTGEEAEPEPRRRSVLAALERIGRSEEEEEEVEEEFRPPQREDDDDSGFSVNKCILAVVILLGLGTIFFSGVFMNLDEESDYGTMEQKDAEEPRKREWLNPEVPPPPVDADSSELLNNLAKGSQQISLLQAQLQKEELKVAKLQAEEGVKERLQWEEMEKENSRLKKEMASLPVLQKENERMKRELESAPALQKELESLRSTVTELKLASAASEAAVKSVTSPPSGQPGNGTQASAVSKERQPKKQWDDEKRKDVKKDHISQKKKEVKEGEVFEWKEGKKRERKGEDKTEWQQGNAQGKFDKETDKGGKQKHHSGETKQWKDKEGKKEKTGREDEGKSWKYKEGKKEWIEKSERKEKEAKDWKKTSHENKKEAKQWRGKEEKKDWKGGKDHAGKHKEEWKKGKDVFEASLKKDWKEKDEKKEWKKKDGDWKSKNVKGGGKEGKGKDDKKPWEESKNHGKERKGWHENEQKDKNGKDERKRGEKTEESRKGGAAGGGGGDRHRDGSRSHGHKEAHRWGGGGGGEHPHTHSRPSPGQPEYWLQQRLRLQRRPEPPRQCGSSETCARAEGLLPVTFPEFRALLQTYLAKAEEAGADGYERGELDKLASEFFWDGVFAHDQTSFREFVEDLGDILEDLVEGDDDEDNEDAVGGEDSDAEEEMEEFEREAMERFSAPRAVEEVGGSKGEWRKQSGPGRG
ncbi:pre-B-cell leukemia homeobox interacting protein 1b isoform X3 [Pungitius pungitius]|uniref:pre-B-cell leukemia homeobox interacting protein 1b isoform X3 n=1 Tax=Pungitius pungitius TaxID=134920 RepID=UPI002E124734